MEGGGRERCCYVHSRWKQGNRGQLVSNKADVKGQLIVAVAHCTKLLSELEHHTALPGPQVQQLHGESKELELCYIRYLDARI